MFKFFRKSQSAIESEILNTGLLLSLEWGKYWLKPINDRLIKKYPQITDAKAEEVNSICKGAREYGVSLVYELAEDLNEKIRIKDFRLPYKTKYPWVSEKVLSSVYNQGMYYAWKDGYLGKMG